MSIYLDASVLVALIQDEEDSDAAIRFVDSAPGTLFVSDYARGEVASAISRRFRMGKIERDVARDRLQAFDEWIASAAQSVTTETTDIRMAEQFVRRIVMGVRMPDAIHLAAAQARGMTLATLDNKMAMVAEMLEIETIEPR